MEYGAYCHANIVDCSLGRCISVYLLKKFSRNGVIVDITVNVHLFVLVWSTFIPSFVQFSRFILQSWIQPSVINQPDIQYSDYKLNKIIVHLQGNIWWLQLSVCISALHGGSIFINVLFVIFWLGMQGYKES